jgi:hypothetical protein
VNEDGSQTVEITESFSSGNSGDDMMEMMNIMGNMMPTPSAMSMGGGIIISSRKNLKKGNGVARASPIKIFSGNF